MTGEWHIVPRTRNNVPLLVLESKTPVGGLCARGSTSLPACGRHSHAVHEGITPPRAGWHPDLCPLQKSICQPSSPFSNSLLTASPLAAWYHIHNAVGFHEP